MGINIKSKADLLKTVENHKLNSEDGEIWFDNHLKIDNTNQTLA